MNLIGDLTFLTSLQDTVGTTALGGAEAAATAVINGSTYVFVAGQNDNGIQVLRLQNNTFVPVFQIVDSNSLTLGGVSRLEVVSVAGVKYLIVSALNESGIASFEINEENTGSDGHLSQVDAIVDNQLDGPLLSQPYDMKTVTVGANTFVIVSSYGEDSLSVYRVQNDGSFLLTDTVSDTDSAALNLLSVWTMATGTVGNRTFIYTGSYGNDGISGFQVAANGTLTSVANVDIAGSLSIRAMTLANTSGGAYLVAFNASTYEMITYSIASNGALAEVSRFETYVTAGPTQHYDFRSLEVFQIDGATFIVGSAYSTDAIAVYSVNDAGMVDYVTSLSQAATDRVVGLHVFSEGGRQYLLATSDTGSIKLVEFGAQDDPLVATAAADRLVGMNGDDDLVGLAGNDSLFGGLGEDVLSGRAHDDRLFGGGDNDVLVGGNGNDVVEGGAGADIAVGGGGIDSLSFTRSLAAVNLNLTTSAANGGDAAGDLYRGFENLIGSGFNDTLTGSAVANRIDGGNGNDQITGLSGADNLFGGNGNDTLSGGDQNDRLSGDAGNDSLLGGNGNDQLRGGLGNDRIAGDAGSDLLQGDDGADTLTGGAGNDTLIGGLGDDVFVFGLLFGDDEIQGFNVTDDRLDLSIIPGINSLAEFQAAAITFAGNTLLSTADGSTVAILGVTEGQFTNANFLF